MPLPVLPADLHPVILEQLVEPISLERFPPHYKHLRAASLVCKDWAKTAQKLLYKHVYLVLEEHRLESFLAGEPKTNWTIQDLALQAADVEGLSERCTELLDRVVDIVRQKPPTRLSVLTTTQPALSVVRGYLVDPGTSTSLELIHLGSPEDGWTDVMHEEAATLKELCGKRGIKLELQGYEE
ncbi:hypothetical protein JCM10213v2_005328 [Rhodosporidiobolus nylandii]